MHRILSENPFHKFTELFFLYTMCFSSKSTSISHKIEVHIESNFHLSVSIDVFNLLMQLT